MVVDKWKYLADAFMELLPQLQKAYAKEGKGKQVLEFLRHEIVAQADEEPLGRILEDLKRELADVGGLPGGSS